RMKPQHVTRHLVRKVEHTRAQVCFRKGAPWITRHIPDTARLADAGEVVRRGRLGPLAFARGKVPLLDVETGDCSLPVVLSGLPLGWPKAGAPMIAAVSPVVIAVAVG